MDYMEYEKNALILDSIDRGTIKTTLQANEYFFTGKLLNSSPQNWLSICKILERDKENKIIVLGKFTETVLFLMCSPNYLEVSKKLLTLIESKKHLIFIYKDNMLGNFNYYSHYSTPFEEMENYFPELSEWLESKGIQEDEVSYIEKVRHFVKKLNSTSLNILPYEKIIDIEISGQSFIENIAEGLLFKIYIPNERMWSNEFDKFINLFRDYASTITNVPLKITQNKTDLGMICSLYSLNEDIKENEIEELYRDFSQFMDLCSKNPNEALQLIENTKITPKRKNEIFIKYSKEAQRLLLDMKHEREIRLLRIKQRLESEIQEFEINENIYKIIEDSIKPPKGINSILTGNPTINNLTINVDSAVEKQINQIVENEINGNIHFSTEEEEIQKLIEKHGENQAEINKLNNYLYELKDMNTSKEEKRISWQHIYKFLSKIGVKVGDVGLNLLVKYIEKKMES